jgi:hypothetical protein
MGHLSRLNGKKSLSGERKAWFGLAFVDERLTDGPDENANDTDQKYKDEYHPGWPG